MIIFDSVQIESLFGFHTRVYIYNNIVVRAIILLFEEYYKLCEDTHHIFPIKSRETQNDF